MLKDVGTGLFRRRLLILMGLFVFAAAVLLARLAQMQLVWHERFKDDYKVSASGDRTVNTTRGSIYGGDGATLAKDAPSFDLSLHYSQLEKDDWVPVVSRLTDTPPEQLRERADKAVKRVQRIWESVQANTGRDNVQIAEQDEYHPIVEDVSEEVAAFVRTHSERFSKIRVSVTRKREYPTQSAPHIIGRGRRLSAKHWEELQSKGEIWLPDMAVNEIGRRYKMDDIIGVTGLENEYEKPLRGERGFIEHQLFFYPLRVEKRATKTPPEPGHDLHLRLRADFQKAVNEALKWADNNPQLDFSSGALVMMDVETGGILAAGTYPSYEREELRKDYSALISRDHNPLLFRPTQTTLPTGSVYKLITAIAGLEEEIISASTRLQCEGRVRFRGRWFNCTGYHRMINLINAIEHSCNTYFFRLGDKLSSDQMVKWGDRFGLGRKTGVDFPSDRSGEVPSPSSLFARLNLAIGQGRLLGTPLQVTRAMAAIANGGRLVRPHFVSHITDREGNVVEQFDDEARTIDVDPDVLQAVRQGMNLVVNGEGGTANDAGLGEYGAAGKTGTAELGPGQPNHAWFAGYAPHDDPKIAFAVVSERTEGHGGTHAAPILTRVMEEIWPEVQEWAGMSKTSIDRRMDLPDPE